MNKAQALMARLESSGVHTDPFINVIEKVSSAVSHGVFDGELTGETTPSGYVLRGEVEGMPVRIDIHMNNADVGHDNG